MKLSRLALCIALLLAVTGCAALASMGGLEVCVSTPGQAAAWTTFDGRTMPRWEALTSETGLETRRRWEVAALAAREAPAMPERGEAS
jgi:hypothetical protein